MNRSIKAAIVALALGTVPPAFAHQSPREQAFAEYMKQNLALALNSVSGFKANVLGTKPDLKNEPDDPVDGRSFSDAFAEMQADSSNSGDFSMSAPVFTAAAADPARNESFYDTFTRMQATSSSSGQFKFPAARSQTRLARATEAP
jgi:hypothetical protein